MKRFVFGLILLMAACGPQATPFPADVPVSATSTPEAVVPIRYALAMNTQGFVTDLDAIQASAQVEQLTEPINLDDLGKRYDVVAAYGDLPGGARSPVEFHVALILNKDAILSGTVQAVIRHTIRPQVIVDRLGIPGAAAASTERVDVNPRTELANSGWPDGILLNMAYAPIPGFESLIEQFQGTGIGIQRYPMKKTDITAALDDNRAQIAVISWGTPDERILWTSHFSEDTVIDLYTIPISYRAIPGLNVTFTADGWPLASR